MFIVFCRINVDARSKNEVRLLFEPALSDT